jgi:[ribosomal protein S18]-alanine N-acetyltransferase
MATPAAAKRILLAAGGSADLDDVMAVMNAAFGDTYGEGWTRSQVAGILPMAGVSMVLARTVDGGMCAGFSLSRAVADEAELLLIAVLPGERRRGIARLLLEEFMRQSRDGSLRRVHLEVRHGNPAAALYRQFGFEPVGRRRDYYQGADRRRHDAITFARDL